MGKPIHKALGRLKNVRVVFHGKYDRGERERMSLNIKAHGGEVDSDLNAKVTHLVLPDLSSGAAMQKKADTLRKKGAAVEVLDVAAFRTLSNPTRGELVAILKDGKRGAKALESVAPPIGAYNHHGAAPECPRITEARLDGLDLSGLNLRGIAFEKCRFVGAKLDNVQISEAIECDFSKSTGDSTHFRMINCSQFANARFKNAEFCSHLHGSNFKSARLDNCEFNENFWGSRVRNPPSKNGPCFDNAFLSDCLFDESWMKDGSFRGADLTGAAFKRCLLEGTSFQSVKASDALFVANHLRNADFTGARLVRSNLAEADLSGAKLKGADLTDANLRGVKIKAGELKGVKGVTADSTRAGKIGAALKQLDTVFQKAKKVEIAFRASRHPDDERYRLAMTAYQKSAYLHLHDSDRISPEPLGPLPFSKEMLQAGRVFGHLPVRFETLTVKSTKSPKSGKELRDLVIQGIAEAFGQEVPETTDAASAADFRDKQRQAATAAREKREQAKAAVVKEKEKAKKQIAKQIQKTVGKVSDVATFLKALELRIEKPKIDKATKMLKASGFKLFNDVTDEHVSGVVKSQTDADLVYACRVALDGQYSCCTQNLNVCGGLRGSICKHLLVLIIGLVQAGELDPEKIDAWIAKTHSVKPELDKETMGAIFIKYKGAEAGEVDWRPTETVPEDYYAF